MEAKAAEKKAKYANMTEDEKKEMRKKAVARWRAAMKKGKGKKASMTQDQKDSVK